jgi:micrococcal nuclease
VRWLAAIVLVAACSSADEPPCGAPRQAVVVDVIDGDTIVLDTGDRVRYLLVDTTEITDDECWSAEAQQFNTDLVLNKTVTLVYDTDACTDRFGRLLAYVSVDGREVNSLLVARGYACTLYIPPGGDARADEFAILEASARAAGVGMWSACDPVPCD